MRTSLAALALTPALAFSQAAPVIPIRQLAPTVFRTTEAVGMAQGVKHLPDGRVLVNFTSQRRLLAFDSTLAGYTVVIDSASGLANSYPRFGAPLVRYRGDTALFVDIDSRAFLVIEPTGTVGRVMAPPRPQDLNGLTSGFGAGSPGFDPQGRLIYRLPPSRPMAPPPPGAPAGRGAAGGGRGGGGAGAAVETRVTMQGGVPATTTATAPTGLIDSIAIIRVDFDTRQADTLTRIKIPPVTAFLRPERGADGKMRRTQTVNPVPPPQDEWAVLSDGSVAIVRGHDYHIDWIYADGTRASTPKMPFDWRRLTDDDKRAKIDSAKRVIDSVFEARGDVATGFMMSSGPDGVRTTDSIYTKYEYVGIDEIADYVPPVRAGSVKPDEDGNLWILPTTSLQAKGGLLYDVVNRQGQIIERVQLPAGRDIVGFGPGGIVYLFHIETPSQGLGSPPARIFLERARVVRNGPVSSSR